MASVPSHVSPSQIEAMNKKANEQMAADGVEIPQETPEENTEELVEQLEEAAPEQEEPEQEEPEEAVKESATSKEDNMRILRERSEKAERERDELALYLQKLTQQSNNAPEKTPSVSEIKEEIEELNINDDDLAEGKHLQKIMRRMKLLEKKLADSDKRTNQTTTEMRLKRDFPDYAEVASPKNLQTLEDQDPELAEAIMATKDPYKQRSLVYKMIKNLGIYTPDTFSKEKQRARNNANKPKPSAAVSPQASDSPLRHANAFANGMTKELSKKLYAEMQEARSRR